jgi:hypothetical protein
MLWGTIQIPTQQFARNHDRPQEPKALDTFRELVNLPLAVYSRISRIELQVCNENSSDGSW